MIKVPAYQCSFDHHKHVGTRFVGKHEVALYRAHTMAQHPHAVFTVSLPASGLSAETYWREFGNVESEYERLSRMYGPAALSRVYPVIQDMQAVIDGEIERVARNKGMNPNAPKEVAVSEDLARLVSSVLPALPKTAKAEEKASRRAEAEKIALELQLTGITDTVSAAAASLSQLCLAPSVDPTLALAIQDTARASAAEGNEPAEGEGRSLDLGALVGRSLEG